MCNHMEFEAACETHRFADTEGGPATGFMVDLKVRCSQCGEDFQFLGMEAGVDLKGARVGIDGTEARLAICPQSAAMSPLDRLTVAAAGRLN